MLFLKQKYTKRHTKSNTNIHLNIHTIFNTIMETIKELKPINQRFNKFIDSTGLTDTRFAEIIGVHENAIYLIRNGKRGVTNNMIQKVALKFPELNTEFIELGRGEMILPNNLLNYTQLSTQSKVKIAMEGSENAKIVSTEDGGGDDEVIITTAKTAFISYYEQMNIMNQQVELLSRLFKSKQFEYSEVYAHLTK